MNGTILVIAGTDTGVGKTWFGCALACALCGIGRSVVALKPMETGCSDLSTSLEDGVVLARATGQANPLKALLRFRDPVAPPEAADRESKSIDFGEVVHQVRGYSAKSEFTLVEGAGGLLSPLTWGHTVSDLAKALGAPVMLVARDQLGTINHSRMALEILAWNHIPVPGLVLTAPERPDASTGSNGAAIIRLSGQRNLICLPRARKPEDLSLHVERVIPWLGLA